MVQSYRSHTQESHEYNLLLYMAYIDFVKVSYTVETWATKNPQRTHIDYRNIQVISSMYIFANMTVELPTDTQPFRIKDKGTHYPPIHSPVYFKTCLNVQ